MMLIRLGRRALKVRHFLVAVCALCGIGIVAGTLLLLARDRQADLHAEDARGRLLASVLESHVSRTLSSVDNGLKAISRVLLLPSGKSGVGPGGVDVQALLDMTRDGKLKPELHAERFPLERAAEAMAALESRAFFGKIVIEP